MIPAARRLASASASSSSNAVLGGVLKVSGVTELGRLSGAIQARIRQRQITSLDAMGEASIYIAVRAVILANICERNPTMPEKVIGPVIVTPQDKSAIFDALNGHNIVRTNILNEKAKTVAKEGWLFLGDAENFVDGGNGADVSILKRSGISKLMFKQLPTTPFSARKDTDAALTLAFSPELMEDTDAAQKWVRLHVMQIDGEPIIDAESKLFRPSKDKKVAAAGATLREWSRCGNLHFLSMGPASVTAAVRILALAQNAKGLRTHADGFCVYPAYQSKEPNVISVSMQLVANRAIIELSSPCG